VQWEPGNEPELPGIRVVAVSPAEELYGPDGTRTIGQALRFGRGVLRHLLTHRGAYDVVHVCAAPYFGLLAAGVARRTGRYRIACDWHEVWSDGYWREYLGAPKGRIAALVQRACARVPQEAFCFSALHARRLKDEGLRGEPTVLRGEWAGPTERPAPRPAEPLVVFAGRHIPEKRVPALVPAIAAARKRIPTLEGEIFGDGPERCAVEREVREHGLADALRVHGFADVAVVEAALARALCMVLPSRREGYGLIVVEAAACGTPSVVVRDPDNAATELVEDGVNGLVADSAAADVLADAIVRIHAGGEALRAATADWFARNARRLSIDTSLDTVVRFYGVGAA
jgi:glycosyltransferase involved in cell wall biosynthesis